MRGAAGVALLPSARLPPTRGTVNSLFDEEIRGHHSMRDHVLTLVTDADLAYRLPGANPSLGELASLRVEAIDEHPFPVQVDGDYIGEYGEIEFSAVPSALLAVS